MSISKGFKRFLNDQKSVGIVLITCAVISLIIANSFLGEGYIEFFTGSFGGDTSGHGNSIEYWINDGLMVLFFLVVGLDLKEEFLIGNLSNVKNSMLPIITAIGGILVPAGIYLLFTTGGTHTHGFGIPMATDIAFAVGMLSLLGKRVPTSMKVFLLALAVIDDLGAIIVIALFYSDTIYWGYLGASLGVFVLLLVVNNIFKVKNLIPYLIGGVFMWWFMLNSGVHATISGVLLAITIPLNREKVKKSGLKILHKSLEKPVNFIVLPLFAIANTAILIQGNISEIVSHDYSLGILGGLVLGKPIGIFGFAVILVALGLCKLPNGLNWKQFFGVSCLAGIGFTMSIFVTKLSFAGPDSIEATDNAILVVIIASLIASIIGLFVLSRTLKKSKK